MPCKTLTDGQGRAVGFACSRGRRPQICETPGCSSPSVALCDFPVTVGGLTGTCDARMCAFHRNSVGANLDHCSKHFAREREGAAR